MVSGSQVIGGNIMISTGNTQLSFTLDGRTHLTVQCDDKVVSQDYFDSGNHKIKFGHYLEKDIEIKIIKKGAQLLDDKKVLNQIMHIKELTVNGIDCLEGKPGKFNVRDNPYVKDHMLETDHLFLDGVWSKQLTFFDYLSEVPYQVVGEMEQPFELNQFENVDIALFGASFLENGFSVDIQKRWFHKIAKSLNCSYQIYSVPGGSNQQVFSLYNEWQKKYRSKIVVLVPTSFSKLYMCVEEKPTMYSVHADLKELLKDNVDRISGKSIRQITDTLFWNGMEKVMALQIPLLYNFFSNIDKKSKLYVMPSIFAERQFFSQTILNKFLLPEWDYEQTRSHEYPTELDNEHYFQKLQRQNFINEMRQYI